MALCRYYQQGRCRFGDQCRYEHSDSGNYYTSGTPHNKSTGDRYHYVRPETSLESSVVKTEPKPTNHILEIVNQDMILAQKGGQWPFSSYRPVKEHGHVAGFDDISQEELRWQMYAARQEGNIDECQRQFQELLQNSQTKINIMSSASQDAYSILQSIYQSSSIPFSQQENLFSPGASTSVFGGSAATNYSANIFGSSGSFSSVQQPPSGLFGAAAAAAISNTASSGIFSPTPNVFPPGPSPAGIFGSAPSNTNSTLFTPTPSSFSSVQPPTGLFSSAAAIANSSSLFTPTPGSFPPAQPPTGLFSSAVTNQTGFFGANQTHSAFGTTHQSSNVFGSNPTTFSSTQVSDSSVYSLLSELSEDMKAAFQAETFLLGSVPCRPPPREWCS